VKHLLRLFSGLKAGQLEISPSETENFHAWKSHYRQKLSFLVRSKKKKKGKLKEKVESDEELVC